VSTHFLDGATDHDDSVSATGHAAVDQEQVLFRDDLGDFEVEHGALFVAVLAGHFDAFEGSAGGQVRADGSAVATVFMRAVGVDLSFEVVTAHDAGEAMAAGFRADIDELADFEDLIEFEFLADFVLCDHVGGQAEFLEDAFGRDARFFEKAAERFVGMLGFSLVETHDQSAVAVFVQGAFSDDDGGGFDDGDALDDAVIIEELSHAELSPDRSWVLVHDTP